MIPRIDALAGHPISVRAPMRVVRSHVAIRELVSLALLQLLGSDEAPVRRYDSGGEVLELREIARRNLCISPGNGGHHTCAVRTANFGYCGNDSSRLPLSGKK